MKILSLLVLSFFTVFSVGAQQNPEGLFINSKAPDFKARDQNGNEINLKELRKKGNIVVMFYRGNWDPFCNRQLKNWQDSLEHITGKGATLIAITAEAQAGIAATIEKTGATFPLIFDQGMEITKIYNGAFNVDEKTVNRYKTNGNDLLQVNLQKKASLPVPAVYIINKEGSVTFRYFDANYRNRLSVKELLRHLK